MIVASHQADLLPYSGFWYKMAKADLFDLKIFDPFQPRGYQRRTLMRGRWASVPVVGNPIGSLICDVRIFPVETRELLSEFVFERYRDAKHWRKFGPDILDMIGQIHTEHLWQFNLNLILGIRDMLKITTPTSIAGRTAGSGVDGLASTMKQYNATTYLSGNGGRAYKGGCEEFHDAGIEIEWSRHCPVSGDSIVTLLMDYDDPLGAVLAEQNPGPTGRLRHDASA